MRSSLLLLFQGITWVFIGCSSCEKYAPGPGDTCVDGERVAEAASCPLPEMKFTWQWGGAGVHCR